MTAKPEVTKTEEFALTNAQRGCICGHKSWQHWTERGENITGRYASTMIVRSGCNAADCTCGGFVWYYIED